MPEKKSVKIRDFLICVGATISISIIMLFASLNETKKIKNELDAAKLVIKSRDNLITEYKKKSRCENYHVTKSDNLLRKHIEIYIKKRYTKTPNIVAIEISKRVILLSKQYNLSPELIVGMIEVESMFNPLLESSKGAKGLMQVMPEWVPKLDLKNVNDLHDINIGIESGIKVFLIHLEEAKGNIYKGLYRYVNKDHSYVKKVYSSVGRFVTYRSTIEGLEKT